MLCRRGFSLIELLIVLSIIALVGSLVLNGLSGSRQSRVADTVALALTSSYYSSIRRSQEDGKLRLWQVHNVVTDNNGGVQAELTIWEPELLNTPPLPFIVNDIVPAQQTELGQAITKDTLSLLDATTDPDQAVWVPIDEQSGKRGSDMRYPGYPNQLGSFYIEFDLYLPTELDSSGIEWPLWSLVPFDPTGAVTTIPSEGNQVIIMTLSATDWTVQNPNGLASGAKSTGDWQLNVGIQESSDGPTTDYSTNAERLNSTLPADPAVPNSLPQPESLTPVLLAKNQWHRIGMCLAPVGNGLHAMVLDINGQIIDQIDIDTSTPLDAHLTQATNEQSLLGTTAAHRSIHWQLAMCTEAVSSASLEDYVTLPDGVQIGARPRIFRLKPSKPIRIPSGWTIEGWSEDKSNGGTLAAALDQDRPTLSWTTVIGPTGPAAAYCTALSSSGAPIAAWNLTDNFNPLGLRLLNTDGLAALPDEPEDQYRIVMHHDSQAFSLAGGLSIQRYAPLPIDKNQDNLPRDPYYTFERDQ